MSHFITVTRLPDDTSDDVEYTIGGEHDGHCETWTECWKAWHRHPQNDYGQYGYDEWSTKRITVEHQWIEDCWMVPGGGCGLHHTFESDSPEWRMTELGIYDVTLSWDGDWWIADLTLRPASTTGKESD